METHMEQRVPWQNSEEFLIMYKNNVPEAVSRYKDIIKKFALFNSWPDSKKREILSQFEMSSHQMSYHFPLDMLENFIQFLAKTATIHVGHTTPILTQLVSYLTPVVTDNINNSGVVGPSNEHQEKVFYYIHKAIKDMKVRKNYYWLLDIFNVLIEKFVGLDICVTNDTVIEKNNGFLLNSIFTLAVNNDKEKTEYEKEYPPLSNNNLSNTLDLCLLLLLNYISQPFDINILDSENKEIEWGESFVRNTETDLAALIMPSFIQHVVPHFGLKNVPFIYFYACGIHPPSRTTILTELWILFLNNQSVNTNNIAHNACFYLSDLITRLENFSISTCMKVLREMANWIHGYIERYDDRNFEKTAGYPQHSCFYVIVQSMLYIFCYRYREFVDSDYLDDIAKLDVSKIIFCSLHPLEFIDPEISVSFSVVAKLLQLEYCSHLISSSSRTKSIFETQFPFSSLNLPHCSKYFEKYFRHFTPIEEEASMLIDSINASFQSVKSCRIGDNNTMDEYMFLDDTDGISNNLALKF
ncbi:RNA polymerase I-specific transcription initiation factor RRN3 [Strongyloides ratti]|uniref:RNA polymerase I-specific transcription initiation factor RRN3 n=1 Tax=Strongyloides ratti TaxID=34506 RepID=A0A090LBD7_STRRB|nr:RNA polymerase I-specific transcription initiation factor RRN3 [Strongyloides ratti]CEF67067.1 RNA polymerase I-specific transcription initiation factor RRN3 [Strongyloides ratti]